MGSTQSSTQSPSLEVKSLPSPGDIANLKSGVRVVQVGGDAADNGGVDIDKKLQSAFETGKEEGRAEIKKSFDALAAQAYGNMTAHLREIQEENLRNIQKTSDELRAKLRSPVNTKDYCGKENGEVLRCFKSEANPGNCAQLSAIYLRCAISAEQ